MTKEQFEDILENVPSGTEFSALIYVDSAGNGKSVNGKIYIADDKRKFWCCYDEGPGGDSSPDKLGYRKSWVITRVNYARTIDQFTIINPEPVEPVIINTYQIY